MIGAAPVPAVFFDGHSAQRHPVNVTLARGAAGLVIEKQSAGGTPMIWPLDRLRALVDQADKTTLTLTLHAETDDETPRDPARLVLDDAELVAWIRKAAPKLHYRDPRAGTAYTILTRLGLAVAAITLILFVILPRMSDYLADRMPLETEVRFGKSVVTQIEALLGAEASGNLVCVNPKGLAALEKMRQRLIGSRELSYDLNLAVLNHPMVNAFAAPGGQVVLIRGLLDKAESADEVAAVLAHEIGHVEARDPTRLMLRAAGSAGIISIVLGDVTGGTLIGVLGDQLLRSSYTREAEAAADDFAIEMLNAAEISSNGMADFFRRIDKEPALADFPEYLSSHPTSSGRAERALRNAENLVNPSPVLTESDWQDLKSICSAEKPDR